MVKEQATSFITFLLMFLALIVHNLQYILNCVPLILLTSLCLTNYLAMVYQR